MGDPQSLYTFSTTAHNQRWNAEQTWNDLESEDLFDQTMNKANPTNDPFIAIVATTTSAANLNSS